MRIFNPPLPDLSPLELYESNYNIVGRERINAKVNYPDAKLVLDIPDNHQFELFTSGLMVCSGVSIGFEKDGLKGMYLSHTLPHMAQQAVSGVDNALSIVLDEGYDVVYTSSIGKNGTAGDAYRDTLLPSLEELAKYFGFALDSQSYEEPCDWYFRTFEGDFESVKTPHCVPLSFINV